MACSNVAMIRGPSTSATDYPKDQCLLHCYLEGENAIGKNSVVEYSWLGKGASIGESSIISNVFIEEGLAVPSDVFLHTVCVKGESGGSLYVTVAFGVVDNLKKTCSGSQSASELKLHKKSLDEVLNLLGCNKVS